MKTGSAAPDFGGWTVDNAVFSSKNFRATHTGAVVVVSFFATWCAPCKNGLLELARLQSVMGDKVAVVLVAFGQDAADVKPFLGEIGVSLPVVLDPYEKQSMRFGVSKALPRTFVVGPDGNVAAVYECEGPDFFNSLRSQVERLTESRMQKP